MNVAQGKSRRSMLPLTLKQMKINKRIKCSTMHPNKTYYRELISVSKKGQRRLSHFLALIAHLKLVMKKSFDSCFMYHL